MIRWLALLALVLSVGASYGQQGGCPLGSTCEPYQGQIPYPAAIGTGKRTPVARASDYGANILEFGADPTDTADSTAAIQAAIDAAANSGSVRSIYCPAGTYKVSQPIFLDPPGNLRGADGTNNASGDYDPVNITYSINDTTNYNGVPYISLQNNNTGNTPSSSPTFWKLFNYNSATTYGANAVVRYNGIPWISLYASNTGNTPGNVSGKIWWLPTTVNQATAQGSFSLTLYGAPGNDNAGTGYGCIIQPINNFLFNGVWIGPGQGMSLRDLAISGVSGAFNQSLLGPKAIAIAVAGGSAGANNTLLQEVEVDNYYTAYETGANGVGSLGAQNALRNVLFSGCEYGWIVGGTQNDINSLDNGQIGCTNTIQSILGPGVSVSNSNVSDTGGQSNTFSISGTSSVTYSGGQGGTYSFTTTIASPDVFITDCFDTTGTIVSAATSTGNCTYNAWMLVTKGFGVIPLTMTSWNGTTNVATFQILPNWGNYFFPFASGGSNALTRSDIQSEIQAQSTIYASQMAVIFDGNAFHGSDIHIENNGQCTQVLADQQGFGGDWGVKFEKFRFNGQPIGGNPNLLAHFLCQQSFPLLDMSYSTAADVDWGISQMGQGSDPVVIDIGVTAPRLLMHTTAKSNILGQSNVLINPSVRSIANDPTGNSNAQNGSGASIYSQGQGGGYWEPCPWLAVGLFSSSAQPYTDGPLSISSCLGYRPDPGYSPSMTANTYALLTSMVPGTTPLTSYFPISGQTTYNVADYSDVQNYQFQSVHQFYSYGQNLTTSNISGLSLSWIGGGFAVAADAKTLTWMFPGLGIKLSNGSGYVEYVVTGVYPDVSLDNGTHPGYFTVLNAAQGGSPYGLTGTIGTAYTASQINEDAFNFGIVSAFAASGAPALSSCGGGSPTATSGSSGRSGAFTTGSGSPTACTVTFAVAYPNQAFCSISPANSAANGVSGGTYVSAQSKSAFTVTLGTGTSSAEYNYTCSGS